MDITKRYRFEAFSNSPECDKADLISVLCDGTMGITDFTDGKFYPRVSHYLVEDDAPFDRYAEAATSETIDFLEGQLESIQTQTIQLRDLLAIAALVGKFAANRGTTIEQAVNFSYTIADKMLKAREAGDES